jgi:methionyl-tRNA formyltransferase
MKIVFMGTPAYAVPTLKMLHETYGVALVVTQPDKKIGRAGKVEYSPVKQYAIDHQLPLFQPIKMKLDYQPILDINPDIIVTAAYGQMIPKAVLDAGISVNLHGSILPKYRGGAPVQYAIRNGETETGVTLMYMAPKMDSGDIIEIAKVSIEPTDTTDTLMHKLSEVAKDLLKKNLPLLILGDANRIPQDETLVSFAYNLKPADECLDFRQTFHQIDCHLRSLLSQPGGSIFIHNTRIKVYEIAKSDIILSGVPGEILSDKKQLYIRCQDSVVELVKIQPENKKIMLAKDFLNGQKLFVKGDIITYEEKSII